ncbi:MAG: DNA-processing protein DprA [Planctomycetota bacterium]
MTESYDPDVLAEVRLGMVSGIGPRLRGLLVAEFGDAAAVFRAEPHSLARVSGIGPKLVAKLQAAEDLDAAGQLSLAERIGAQVVLIGSETYPRALREIPDPPAVLFAKGEIKPEDARSVAIVGSRHPTKYGRSVAQRLATDLAHAGVTVVSGLARGVDAVAHRAALEAGGRTLAVLAGGHARLYPPEHAGLADDVAASGCVLTESPPGMPPLAGSFPQRNRIISGLSLGSVVVEASDRSGALITSKHAAEQGREVFAVPGPIDSRLSRGCHALIQDGAKLVQDVEDILEELPPGAASPAGRPDLNAPRPTPPNLNEVERRVYEAIGEGPTAVDAVVEISGIPVHRVLSTISVLEVRRVVRRISGTLVARE